MSESDKIIVGEYYFTARDGMEGALTDDSFMGRYTPMDNDKQFEPINLTMICVLVLNNGKTVVGWNQCESYENSNVETASALAKEKALSMIDAVSAVM